MCVPVQQRQWACYMNIKPFCSTILTLHQCTVYYRHSGMAFFGRTLPLTFLTSRTFLYWNITWWEIRVRNWLFFVWLCHFTILIIKQMKVLNLNTCHCDLLSCYKKLWPNCTASFEWPITNFCLCKGISIAQSMIIITEWCLKCEGVTSDKLW